MKLIRPFDYDSDTLAIFEDEEWKFEVIVSPDIPDLRNFELFHVDVPTTEEDPQRTVTIVVNEKWLLEICQRILSAPQLDDELVENGNPETYNGGMDEMMMIQAMRIKKRAVSIALEILMEYAEAYILDKIVGETWGYTEE